MTDPITFTVPDMTCGHCEAAIRGALAKELPGADIDIDLQSHRVTVAGDRSTAEKAIREAGYTPEAAQL
ncbi:heavy-metal-associated domain-containing protein [Pelagibacterium xiamenense]|uniref:heavy-metal-associated domain-containing protein n=1 Tax=Pelagibacterium xiamenense TaxID=2901140 RepID=UPI001E36E4AA|nr:heavy-metal-associated domain-containing protein [Pelagibacterium xiamenense]MCD7060262.1 heavy-metal-associated domain-containing protein [Pelagibacterium xiamenense]